MLDSNVPSVRQRYYPKRTVSVFHIPENGEPEHTSIVAGLNKNQENITQAA